MKIIKITLILIIVVAGTRSTYSQSFGFKGKKFVVSVAGVVCPSGRDFGLYNLYIPKTDSVVKKRSFVNVPFEIGLGYTVGNKTALKAQYGHYKAYSRINVPGVSSNVYVPFYCNDFTFGVQLNKRQYFSPICKGYTEIEYTHAFYRMDNGYYTESFKANFATLSIGWYSNIYFNRIESVMFFLGIKFGIPLYNPNRFVGGDVPTTDWISKSVFDNVRRMNMINKAAQFKMGIKYILPF